MPPANLADAAPATRKRIFLLSPANAGGKRYQMAVQPQASFDLAFRLRNEGAPIGEVFSFISGLYFRGKLAYSQAFCAPPEGIPGAFVIAASRGLIPTHRTVSIDDLVEIGSVPINVREPRFRVPFERDAKVLAERAGPNCDIVLLGSVATAKYVEPLLTIFGERLLFPTDFAGRGDMSRGGLMLRCVRAGVELDYVSVLTGKRHGPRPPKLR